MHRIMTFVLAEEHVDHGQPEEVSTPLQSAPSYVSASIPHQIALDKLGWVTLKIYQPNVLMAESVQEVKDTFSSNL